MNMQDGGMGQKPGLDQAPRVRKNPFWGSASRSAGNTEQRQALLLPVLQKGDFSLVCNRECNRMCLGERRHLMVQAGCGRTQMAS